MMPRPPAALVAILLLTSCRSYEDIASRAQLNDMNTVTSGVEARLPDIVEELATTGSTGVLIAAQPAPSPGYESASIEYAFGDSPADAIAALDGVDINNSSTICIYRYNDSIPLLPEVRPCKAVAQEVASTQQLRAALDELQIVRTDLAELRILASQNQRALERSQETIARISDRVDAIAETSAEIYNLIQPQLPPFAAPDPGADRTE